MRHCTRFLAFASALLSLLLAAAPGRAELAAAEKELAAAEKEQIEAVVRDYLLANPEVIEQAIGLLRQKRESEAAASQAKAVETSRQLIFDSQHQMVLGNPQGQVTLVEFFDYNCGYCKRAVSDMTALLDANPDLRIVLKEFPILSQGSVEAARFSVAVKDLAPDRYLEFHEQLFTRPGPVDGAKAVAVAADIGLDVEELKRAANTEGVTRNLQEVQQLANTLGISGTPSYVIGSEIVPGAAGFDALQQKIAAMRECGASSCS
jgi:protein-disulfide isomerase